jgi:hypothetical protein
LSDDDLEVRRAIIATAQAMNRKGLRARPEGLRAI